MIIFQGCAIGIGFSAGNNLDQVLNKLEQVSKNEMAKKSSGILSFMKVGRVESVYDVLLCLLLIQAEISRDTEVPYLIAICIAHFVYVQHIQIICFSVT